VISTATSRTGEAAPLGGRPLVLAAPGHLFTDAPVPPRPPVYVAAEFEHVLDPTVERALLEAGGLNPFGQPNYRCVWGYQRGDWIGGQRYLKYIDRARHCERWHLEKWVPAESFGTPESWYSAGMVDVDGAKVNVLGAYPADGDYVRVIVFENYFTGEFVAPTADMVVEAIIRNRQHAEQSKLQIRQKIQADLAARKKAADERMDAEIGEREAAFPFRTWIATSGPTTPEYRRRDVWEPPRH
jgi:hypothetical protein